MISQILNKALIVSTLFLFLIQAGCSVPGNKKNDRKIKEMNSNTDGMVWIPGGEFTMGNKNRSVDHEFPSHEVSVKGFWMDATEVTNAQFKKFVDETGYVTVAERPVNWDELKKQLPQGTPKPDESLLVPGSLVFTPPDHPVSLVDYSQWWSWVPGASWKHPGGPTSTIQNMDSFPVVQIAYEDAHAYA